MMIITITIKVPVAPRIDHYKQETIIIVIEFIHTIIAGRGKEKVGGNGGGGKVIALDKGTVGALSSSIKYRIVVDTHRSCVKE